MKERVKSILKFIRRERTLTKILSFTLCLVMVFYVIPSTIYTKAAELLENEDGAEAAPLTNIDSEQSEVETNNGVLFEDVSLREESAKHFHLEDGRYVAAQYNYPVHILDSNGEWQDIDNALVESGSEFTNSNARIKFAKKINGSSELFALHDGNTKLTLTLIDAVKGTVGEITNLTDTESDTELQKMMNLEKLSASVIYRDILDGVDLEYVAYSMNVKENIIVKEKKESYSYSFELKLNGLTPTLTESGDIEIRSDDTDGLTYIIPAPVVFDSEGAYAPSDRAYYSLTHKNGKKYTLTVTVDSAWMNAEERAFPVTVDPAVMSSSSTAIDVNISSSNPDTVSNSGTEITVMTGSTTTMLMHWKMPTLPTVPLSAKIVDARITLVENTIYGVYVGAYDVLNDWDETLTWTKYINTSTPQGTLGNIVDYVYIEWPGAYEWNITKLAEEWYRGNNFGVAFKCIPKANTLAFFYSAEATSNQPSFTVTYKDMKGIESYWPFSSHSAGIAGEGNVNLANGNLVFTIPTLTTTDNIFSYTPYLTYDSSMSNKAYYSGNANISLSSWSVATGFKLSINESIMLITLQGVNGAENYYVYSDADGTEHYFFSQSDGKYRDEDGLGLILTAEVNGDISVINDAKVKRYFKRIDDVNGNPSWILEYIEDISQNRLIFTYRAPHMLTNISLLPNGNTTAIILLEFWYDQSTDALTMVYNSAAKTAVVFRYSDTYNSSVSIDAYSYLRQIDYAVGNANVAPSNWVDFIYSEVNTQNITVYDTARYNYNSSGKITEVVNVKANTSVKYTWSGNYINKISEYAGTSLGNEVRFGFSNDYTYVYGNGNDGILGTTDDIKNSYIMDSYGRCTDVYSTSKDGRTVYGAGNYSYDTQENSKNSIKQSATLGSQSVNYVMNGSFEDMNGSSPSHWTLGGNASSTAINGVKGSFEKSVTLMPTENYGSSISQIMVLYYGTYTLSFPMHVTNGEGMSGSITVRDYKTDALIYTEDISPIPHSGEGFFSTTFNIPRVDAHRYIELEISFTAPSDSDSVHTVELDSVMLAKTIGVESFNMVQFGGFEYTLVGSDGYQTTIPANYWADESGNAVSVGYLDTTTDRVATITNTNGAERYMKQTLYQATASKLAEYNAAAPYELDKQHHTLSVSGFANLNNTSSDRPAGLKVVIQYYRGTGISDIQDTYVFDFNTDNEEWQFTSGNVILGYTQDGALIDDYLGIRSITIYCDCSYSYGAVAAFNNISVTYAGIDSVTKYTYTEDGRIESVVNGSDGQFYLYNANGNVAKIADNKGNLIEYVYSSAYANRLVEIKEYTFTHNGLDDFPYYLDDPFSEIIDIPKRKITYVYNLYGLVTSETMYILADDGSVSSAQKYIRSTYTYDTNATSKIFGAPLTETDSNDITTKYIYNKNTGRLLASINMSTGLGTAYTYNVKGQLIRFNPAVYNSLSDGYTEITSGKVIVYSYNSANELAVITDTNTMYRIMYDEYRNIKSIQTDSKTLVHYTYGENNGKLERISYGNGTNYLDFVYNDLEMLTEIWYNGDTEATYLYEYTSEGKLSKCIDNSSNTTTLYKYDADGRVIDSTVYDSSSYKDRINGSVVYNDDSSVEKTSYYLNDFTSIGTSKYNSISEYNYSNGLLTEETIRSVGLTANIKHRYDSFDRYSGNYIKSSIYVYESKIIYKSVGNKTSGLVSNYVTFVNGASSSRYTYQYDGNNFISKITDKLGYETRYSYDNYGQLISEENESLSRKFVYTYDDYGNILTRETYSLLDDGTIGDLLNTDTYTYTIDNWLYTYNGGYCIYDSAGRPTRYYNGNNYSLTWKGDRINTITTQSTTFTFTYDGNGLRTSKTNANGIVKEYYYLGDLLLCESTDSGIIVYIYDAFNSPIGFRYRSSDYVANKWDTYWYEKNLQGDVVAVYNEAGTKLVAYKYDAWGRFTTKFYNDAINTSAIINPIKYRGYYYDSDLGMYYLQSRYYDPAVGRFISPDDPSYLGANGDLTSYNLYAYCSNNPVNYTDSNGHAIHPIVAGTIIGAGIGLITSIFVQAGEANGDISKVDIWETLFDVAVGGVNGAFAASNIPIRAAITIGALIGGTTSIIKDYLFNDGKIDVGNAIWGAVVGGVCGIIAGAGANNLNDGSQVSKFVSSWKILNNTIANGTKNAISKQTAVVMQHAKELVVSGARYLLSNFFSILGSEAGGWWDD